MEKARNSRRAEIGAQRSLRTRNKLIDAAARVIGLQGENVPAIEEFIKEAGVSRGTFYKHFSTRHDLMAALWEKVGREPYHQTWIRFAEVSDRAERIMIGAKQQLLRAQINPSWGWLTLRIWLEEGQMYDDIQSLVIAEIAEGRDLGRFKCHDPEHATCLVLGALMGANKLILTSEVSEDFVPETCEMILRLLGLEESDARAVARRPLPDGVTAMLAEAANTPTD